MAEPTGSENGYLEDEEIQEVLDVEDNQSEADFGNEQIEDGVVIEEDLDVQDGDMDAEDDIPNDATGAFTHHTDSVYAVALHPENEDIAASAGGDDKAYVWKVSTGEKIFDLNPHKDSVIDIAFSKSGKFLATAGMDGVVNIYDTADGKLVIALEAEEIVWIEWHPRGNILLAGTQGGTAWMWAANGQVLQVFSGHTASITCGGFTPDGKLVVTGSEDGSVIVWDPKTAAALHKFSSEDSRLNQGPIISLGFSPDSSLVLTGSEDHHSKLLHIQTGKLIASFEQHTEGVETVSFSNSSPLVATGGIDGKICIWDVKTFRLRHALQHDDAVVKVAWHPTEPILYSCSMDKTLRIWDARTGACLKVFRGHHDPLLGFVVSKNGSTIITGSDDSRALVFRL